MRWAVKPKTTREDSPPGETSSLKISRPRTLDLCLTSHRRILSRLFASNELVHVGEKRLKNTKKKRKKMKERKKLTPFAKSTSTIGPECLIPNESEISLKNSSPVLWLHYVSRFVSFHHVKKHISRFKILFVCQRSRRSKIETRFTRRIDSHLRFELSLIRERPKKRKNV